MMTREGLEALLGNWVVVYWFDIEEHDPCNCELDEMHFETCWTTGVLVWVDDLRVILQTEQRCGEKTRQLFPRGCISQAHALWMGN